MEYRAHVWKLALGTALFVSALAMPATQALALGPTGTTPVVPAGTTAVPAKAFPGGVFVPGSGGVKPSVDLCDTLAGEYNLQIQDAAKAYSQGNVAEGNGEIQLAVQTENEALDNGCVWID
jgi:hypothetical protein